MQTPRCTSSSRDISRRKEIVFLNGGLFGNSSSVRAGVSLALPELEPEKRSTQFNAPSLHIFA